MDFNTIYQTYLLVYGKDYTNPATAAADGFPDVPTAMRTAAETFSLMDQLSQMGYVVIQTDAAHPLGYWVPVGDPGNVTIPVVVPDYADPYTPGTITTLPLPPMPVPTATPLPPTPIGGPVTVPGPWPTPTPPSLFGGMSSTTLLLIAAIGLYLFTRK